MRSLIVLTLILALFSCTPPKSKILIIGDSISIGYTPFVKSKLKAQADVHHNPGNAQHTGTGLQPSMQVHEHFGMGIKDVHYTEAGYAELGELVASFLKTEIAKSR